MKFFHKRSHRITAIIVAAALLVGSVAAGLTVTFAADPAKQFRFKQQNTYSVLHHGKEITFPAYGVSGADLADTSLGRYTFAYGATPEITFTPDGVKKAGVARIGRSGVTGAMLTPQYFQVVNPAAITGYDLFNGGNGYVTKTSTDPIDLKITYYSSPAPTYASGSLVAANESAISTYNSTDSATLADQVEWESLDESILEVSANKKNVYARAKGITTLVGKFTDRWGVDQTIIYQFGVGIVPGRQDTPLNDLLRAIEEGKKLQQDASENDGKYDPDLLIELGEAIIAGEELLKNSEASDSALTEAADDIWDIIDALRPGGGSGNPTIELIPDDNNNGGANDKWYRPVINPPHVYEVVNEDGSPKQPPKYVYDSDKNGNPSDGQVPAYGPKDGKFYVENPAGSNIYKPVDSNGELTDTGAIWGGDDKVFGSGDDTPAVTDGGKWYADLGQNVFGEVAGSGTNKGKLTDNLLGGGENGKPGGGDDITPIFDNTANDGRYYAGPYNDSNGEDYYIGDQRPATDGISTSGDGAGGHDGIDDTDRYYKMDGNGNMVEIANPDDKIPGTGGGNTDPTPIDSDGPGGPGEDGSYVLDDSLTGDTGVNWIGIAQTEDYLLIVRDTAIAGSADAFGDSNTYGVSAVKDKVEDWYKNAPSKLKYYVVRSNAATAIGSFADNKAGLSVPATGAKTAFVLSFQESLLFLNGASSASTAAKNNWAKISDKASVSWLRTVGTNNSSAAALSSSGNRTSLNIGEGNYARPALWVDKSLITGEDGGGGGGSKPATALSLSVSGIPALTVGSFETVVVTKTPADTTDTLSVSSSAPGTASAVVDGNGNIVVTGVAVGSATITVTLGSKAQTIAVTVNAAIGSPEEGTGRTFTDTSGTWLEIATNGGYSLILRTTNISAGQFNSYTTEGSQYYYSNSLAQQAINNWYTGLSNDSLIKQYAVDNTAKDNLGTRPTRDVNQAIGAVGISAPLQSKNQTSDIAFPLSSEEAARYCCGYYYNGSAYVTANDSAYKNWLALSDRANSGGWWLRSPGFAAWASYVYFFNGVVGDGDDAYLVTTSLGLRPALWVESAIFNPAPPTDGIPIEGTGRYTNGGDGSKWVEIATNGGYSLILRGTVISNGPFNANGSLNYVGSDAQTVINNWYAGVISTAAIKQYAVDNDATLKIGTWNVTNTNGFSSPIASKTQPSDVAFLLSLQEAAKFCSTYYYDHSSTSWVYNPSTGQAYQNWQVLKSQGDAGSPNIWNWWLRTPCQSPRIYVADGEGYGIDPTVVTCHFRPALWVETSKFTWTS